MRKWTRHYRGLAALSITAAILCAWATAVDLKDADYIPALVMLLCAAVNLRNAYDDLRFAAKCRELERL